jgi:hypothetical protein
MMNTEIVADVSRLRSQLTTISRNAERAFERAFDLQQAGAPAERVDAAMAEVQRLQESARKLSEQLGVHAIVH